MFNWLKNKRRDHYKKTGITSAEINIISAKAPITRKVPDSLRRDFYETVAVFVKEKNFEGCGGLELTNEIKLTIASQASLLLIGGISDYYPDLFSILVYPTPYFAPVQDMQEDGVVVEGRELRHGESWGQGSLVLAWDEAASDSKNPNSGRNLIIHEFSHEIDQEFGLTESATLEAHPDWGSIMKGSYEDHLNSVDFGRPTLLDPYGATDLAEFFAVSTEAFFGIPVKMQKQHPQLYQQLAKVYNLDPVSWRRI